MKHILLTTLLALSIVGCANKPVTTRTTDAYGNTQIESTPMSQSTLKAKLVEEARMSCYGAIVAIEQAKVDAMRPLYDQLARPATSEMGAALLMSMINQQTLVALLGEKEAPLQCKQAGYYTYKVQQQHTIADAAKRIAQLAFYAYVGGEALDLGKVAVKALARPTVATSNGPLIFGDRNTQDNSVINPEPEPEIEEEPVPEPENPEDVDPGDVDPEDVEPVDLTDTSQAPADPTAMTRYQEQIQAILRGTP